MMGIIEVERKFVLPEDFNKRLSEFSAIQESCSSFQDVYYDTQHYSLSTQDHWLRKRNGVWQLKFPVDSSPSSSVQDPGPCSLYQETEEESEVAARISLLLSTGSGDSRRKLDAIVEDLDEFAIIRTERTSYLVDGVRIVVDVADFGLRIGELEVMATSRADIPAALQKIQNIADKLDLSDPPMSGKIETFLKKNSPGHYKRLVESNVFSVKDET